MSTKIRVTCSACSADCQLTSSAFHLTVFDAGDHHYYEFFCPTCFELCRQPADSHVQSLLMNAEVEMDMVHVPEEFLEPKLGPRLTVDDVMDFCIALRRFSAQAMLDYASARVDSNHQPTA